MQNQNGDGGIAVDKALPTTASVLYDAVLVPGGEASMQALAQDPDVRRFIEEAYRHGKPIGALDSGVQLVAALTGEDLAPDAQSGQPRSRHGLVVADTADTGAGEPNGFVDAFALALCAHRFPDRATPTN